MIMLKQVTKWSNQASCGISWDILIVFRSKLIFFRGKIIRLEKQTASYIIKAYWSVIVE